MKIDDVKVGEEYALQDGRPRGSRDPRRVKALEIVTVEERYWSDILERRIPRNVRRVRVKYLDAAKVRWAAAKGAEDNVDARYLVAPWAEIAPSIRERIENEAAIAKEMSATEKRVKALLGRNYDGYVTRRGWEVELDTRGKSLEKLLALAEKGKASV